jgi:Tfp pilus assembly protein PilN
MVKLNLLPSKVRSAELLRLVALVGVVVYALVAGLIGWRLLVASRGLAEVALQVAKVDAELKPLKVIADEVKKLTDEKNEQDTKKARLVELTKRQAYLVRVLDMLPDFVQGGQVWLTTLDQTADKGGARRVSLEGRSLSMEAWADFYSNLESQSLIDGLKIETAPMVGKDGTKQYFAFKVSFVLKDPS